MMVNECLNSYSRLYNCNQIKLIYRLNEIDYLTFEIYFLILEWPVETMI